MGALGLANQPPLPRDFPVLVPQPPLLLRLRKPGVAHGRERGGEYRAEGRGRQRTPRGPAGSWEGGQAGSISPPRSPSPRQYQTLRLLCTRRGAEDFPRTKPTAGVAVNFTAYNPLPYPSCQPRGCGRVRLVPGSMSWGWEERDGGWTDRLRTKMDTGARDAGPVEIPARDVGAPSRQGGHGPKSRLRGRRLEAEIGKG